MADLDPVLEELRGDELVVHGHGLAGGVERHGAVVRVQQRGHLAHGLAHARRARAAVQRQALAVCLCQRMLIL